LHLDNQKPYAIMPMLWLAQCDCKSFRFEQRKRVDGKKKYEDVEKMRQIKKARPERPGSSLN